MPTTVKKMVKGSLKAERNNIEGPEEAHKYFNLQRVIENTNINQDKIYNNMRGKYNSLTPAEKKRIATCLMGPVKNLFERLGMSVNFATLADHGSK